MAIITIRPYRAADEAALLSLIRDLQAHERAIEPLMKPEADIGLEYIAWLEGQIGKYGGEILIADADGLLAGYAVVVTQMPSEDEDEIAYEYAFVRDIAVNASQRGKGIGKRLLAECEQRARDVGAERLRITVLSRNEGPRALYTKFGFAERITEMEKPLE